MKRDLSEQQYRDKMEKMGFKRGGFMGYWSLPAPLNSCSVSDWNAGKRRRDKLSYMTRAWKQRQKEEALKTA